MRPAVILLLVSTVLVGCSTDPTGDWRTPVQKEHVRRWQALEDAVEKTSVESSDGISEVEAYKIAHDYFFGRGFTPCGIVDIPKDEGTDWRVPLLEGIFPGLSMYVVIDKKTGAYRVEDVERNLPNQALQTTRYGAARLRSCLT